jgi:NADH-quinone oxidoreductase subunit N
MQPGPSLAFVLPELALVAALVVLLVVDLVRAGRGGAPGEWPATIAFVGVGAALLATLGLPGVGLHGLVDGGAPRWLFGRMLSCDAFATFFHVLLGLALLATVAMSLGSREVRGRPDEAEYYAILLGSGVGLLLMSSAAHLLMAYLSLELVSLTAYALTGLPRHDRRAGEAALKYLLYGGVASGTMLFGMSWVFGLTGAMDYAGIAHGVATLDPQSRGALFVALVLVLVGFGYKIAAVPFHMWAPDVYTGAPLPVTAFLAVGSKAAGFALLLRFFGFGVGAHGPSASLTGLPLATLLGLAAVATMTVGNLAALGQTNLKRLLAYSSIAHAGYALLGVVVFRASGVGAVLFYLAVYYVMNLGAFWVVMLVANRTGREDLDAFRGLAWRGGAAPAVALAVFLFSLAGLPPLAGFVGKFQVFAAGIQAGLWPLVVIAVLNSVVSLYYYAKVARAMFLDAPAPDDPPLAFPLRDLGGVGALSVLTVWLGVWFGWLLERALEAGRTLAG